jgi:hypothetical protein
MGGIRGPGMARGREGKVGYVKAGDDLHHSFDFFRFAGMYFLYQPVSNSGMQYFSNQRVPFDQIIGVLCSAGYFFPPINPWYTLSYAHSIPIVLNVLASIVSCFYSVKEFFIELTKDLLLPESLLFGGKSLID